MENEELLVEDSSQEVSEPVKALEAVSLEKVKLVIKTHSGKRDKVVDLFVEKYLAYNELPYTVGQWKEQNYALLREAAYPSLEEQLGMQYDDSINGTTTWLDMQESIKAKYPKVIYEDRQEPSSNDEQHSIDDGTVSGA